MKILDIFKVLTKNQIQGINTIVNLCKDKNINCYIVGGAVRDAVLNIPPRDIDICIDVDPKDILSLLDLKESTYYSAFNTASIKFESGVEFDIIRCRKETYQFNGALPIIMPSTIFEDLKRRDFTINALAYDMLNEKIIDPFMGLLDIEKGIIKSVHANSYMEDPTRIFRAIKYAIRYGFSILELKEIQNSIKNNVMDTISNDRYYKEIIGICKEEKWREILKASCKLKIFQLEVDKNNIMADYNYYDHRLLNIAFRLKEEKVLEKILDNSSIKKEIKHAINNFKYGNISKDLHNSKDNYEIYKVLKNTNSFDRIMLSFDYKNTYKVLNYIKHLNYKPSLKGSYINDVAKVQGKALGEIIDYISKVAINVGIVDEEKYFNENLGEILNAIEYKA